MDDRQNGFLSKSDRLAVTICLLTAVTLYVFLHTIYRPDNMDDAWFLSIARNHIVNGIETDEVFGGLPGSGGFGGVVLFGKTYTHIYGSILNLAGWTKSNSHAISLVFMLISAACWFGITVSLGYGRTIASFFAALLLIVEPFFGAANQARPDAMSFFCVSAGLFLFLKRSYLPAGFLAIWPWKFGSLRREIRGARFRETPI